MTDELEEYKTGEEEDEALQKEHRAWMKRLKLKAALWDELRELAIKRGLVTDGEPHRKVRARLVAALQVSTEIERI